MSSLVVGCPVAHRAWILDDWFDHVEASCTRSEIEPSFAFIVDAGDRCLDVIERRSPTAALEIVPPNKGTDDRRWNPARFTYMVEIRNRLLNLVRAAAPSYFLSIDSDVLAHPNLVGQLIGDIVTDERDAVGGKCYMSEVGLNFPSWGRFGPSGSLQRYDANGYFAAQVIMAIKLMSPRAYAIDYELDLQGEDVGWSRACARQGLRLAWDGRITSKHIFHPRMLHRIDARVGY